MLLVLKTAMRLSWIAAVLTARSPSLSLLSLRFLWATHLCLVKGAGEIERKGNKRGGKRAEAEQS